MEQEDGIKPSSSIYREANVDEEMSGERGESEPRERLILKEAREEIEYK